MQKSRRNHYVPKWYQEGFFEPGNNTLAYLDLKPNQTLPDGRVVSRRALFDAPTSRAFVEQDLYSTFFGLSVNDEIERKLFGDIDTRGSMAVRAFVGSDVNEWIRRFEDFYEFIDTQKIRTPKGLDWLRAQYPELSQNELMFEMQGIRMMNCTIWTEGVREIVSAEDADVKFIVGDHPVTVYNYAFPPDARACAYPDDPRIALKGSQTLFPLNRDFCLILTNLEYARDPSVNPLEKRTFARNFKYTMIKRDSLIRTRKLSSAEVIGINHILKTRARRYVAAGRQEWLYPEKGVTDRWRDLKQILLPPKNGLFGFGGEMFAKFDSGHVHYQDEFGRTEKEWEFLKKKLPDKPLRAGDNCGCGSGRAFRDCCRSKPERLRPAWDELSIRERNLMMFNALTKVLGLREAKDWLEVRRNLTDDKIKKAYELFGYLWPRETDLLKLLPKPDGCARAVYTGSIHPTAIADAALGATLYFGEVLIEHPFLHPGSVNKKFSPVENPDAFRQEFLKSTLTFLELMPLVEAGVVNFIPDLGTFDVYLRDQVNRMAQERSAGIMIDPKAEPRAQQLIREDMQRSFLSMPANVILAQLKRSSSEVGISDQALTLEAIRLLKERDPLVSLQEDAPAADQEIGRLMLMKLVPNFEMAMYLAQATGACIVTDSRYRWAEVRRAIRRPQGGPVLSLAELADELQRAEFLLPNQPEEVADLASREMFEPYRALMRDTFRYLADLGDRSAKPNREAHLAARFGKLHAPAQAVLKKAKSPANRVRIHGAFPSAGIQDNTINRLLLMSSSEYHLPRVPMAFFIENLSFADGGT